MTKNDEMCVFPCTMAGTTYNKCIDTGRTNCIGTSTMCNWLTLITGQILPFRSEFSVRPCCTGYEEGAWCCTQVDSGQPGNAWEYNTNWGFCKMEWEGGHCDAVTGISSHKNCSSRCISLNDAVPNVTATNTVSYFSWMQWRWQLLYLLKPLWDWGGRLRRGQWLLWFFGV